MLQGASEAMGLSVLMVVGNEGQCIFGGRCWSKRGWEQGGRRRCGMLESCQSPAQGWLWVFAPLPLPGEMVMVREEMRLKGCSSQGALRASDKGVREQGRKHLAGLAINGHFEKYKCLSLLRMMNCPAGLPRADSTACRGIGGLPWQCAVEEKASKPEAALNPALKGWYLGRKDIDILEKHLCFNVGSCREGGCCSGWRGGSLSIRRRLCPRRCAGQVEGNLLQRGG